MTIRTLTESLIQLRNRKYEAEKDLKEINETYDKTEAELFAKMDEEKVQSVNYADLGVQVVAVTKKFPRIRPEDKGRDEEIFAWLESVGYGAIVRRQVAPQTLKASLKEIAEGGVEMPSFCEVYEQNTVSLRRA